ncbi:hypothetical protein [Endozoicomonas sp. ONNA2]|uniref:hypothetical protein n=1 Tax=Endozoicomonas sp. ONNA2 TaxID=2828741 RepID=UPI002148EA97|nr:hypothetical protein [Endozoicomonas sp. ONNA2]
MNKAELEQLSDVRIREAQILLDHRAYNGDYYLAGYSVECAIKVCICHKVQAYDFPDKKLARDSHSHRLTELIKVAGLQDALVQYEKANPLFMLNWLSVKDWAETSRYDVKSAVLKRLTLLLPSPIRSPGFYHG